MNTHQSLMRLFIGVSLISAVAVTPVQAAQFKVLHIMSYDSSWVWNQEQLEGFKKGLEGVDVEYNVFELDTKRNSSKEWFDKVSQEAKALIETWQPDLVYTNDDNAQQYVAKDYVNTAIPFVFSAVNSAPEKYGFTGSANVTGILEQEHFVQSVNLLKKIVPAVKKIAVIVDIDPMWEPIVARMKAHLSELPEVEFVSWNTISTYQDFQQKMTELQTSVDAVGLIGIFLFKDENGKNVPYQDVLRWTADNSQLPDFTFWEDRISYGTLCTVTVSGYEQGLAAGKLAREILVNGRKPAEFPMVPTVKGKPVVSLARARKIGIPIHTEILLTADIIKAFRWEE